MKPVGILILILWSSVLHLKAQSGLVFYHETDQANASVFNPAYIGLQKKFTVSLSPLGGINLENNNLPVSRDLLKTLVSPPVDDDTYMRKLFLKLASQDVYYHRIEYSLLNASWLLHGHTFNVRIRDVEQMTGSLSGSFSNFISIPDLQSIQNLQHQSFPGYGIHYREYSLGYARNFLHDKLLVGVRAKLYSGMLTASSDLQGNVAIDTDKAAISLSGMVKISAPIVITKQNEQLMDIQADPELSNTDYILGQGNSGTGIDIGMLYKITPATTFTASVLDIGKIHWKRNINSLKFPGNPILVDPTNSVQIENSVYQLATVEDDKQAFTTQLPSTYLVGLSHQLTPLVKVGITGRTIRDHTISRSNLMVTGQYRISKTMSVTSGYSYNRTEAGSVPLALFINNTIGQAYIATDNFLALTKATDSTLATLCIGTSIYLFTSRKKYEKGDEQFPFFKQKKNKPRTLRGLIFNDYPGKIK